jgi:hypothetical protein
MSRTSSLPILFDQCTILSTKELMKWGYLRPGSITHGQIKWVRHNYDTTVVSIAVDTIKNSVQLNYSYNGNNFNYQLELSGVKSNLGKGIVYFLVCPKTGTRCRKLHLYGGIFRHRSSFDGFYQWQVYGKKDRNLCKIYDLMKYGREAVGIINSKNFKRFYNGVPTKRYSKYLSDYDKGKHYPADMMGRLMLGLI